MFARAVVLTLLVVLLTAGLYAQGTIAGAVTDESSGMGIPWVQIQIYKSDVTTEWIQVITDLKGNFKTTVDPGTYLLYAIPPYSSLKSWQAEWYKDAADRDHATPVVVSNGGTSTADIALGTGGGGGTGKTGTLTGKVIDDVSSSPIAGVRVLFFNKDWAIPLVKWAVTDAGGIYKTDLAPGPYILKFEPPLSAATAYVPEWYDNVQSPDAATVVEVKEGETATANAGLEPVKPPALVKLGGTVKDDDGAPLAGARVVVMRSMQEMASLAGLPDASTWDIGITVPVEPVGNCHGVIWTGLTDDKGEYAASVPGNHSCIALAAKAGYLAEYYQHKASPLTADVIKVETGDVTGIDFTLAAIKNPEGSLGGLVKDEAGNGIPSRVIVIPVANIAPAPIVRFTHTDDNGVFTIENLAPGKYVVLAVPFCGYAPAFYKAGSFGVLSWKDADVVYVSGDIRNVIVGVVPIKAHGLACLIGRLHAKGGAPLAGASVTAATGSGIVVGYGVTDADGSYRIESVVPGSITLTADREGYQPTEAAVSVPTGVFEVGVSDIVLDPVSVTSAPDEERLPQTYELSQNYPNPFNPTTTIGVDLPVESMVKLSVLNLLGQEVSSLVDGVLPAGHLNIVWNGRDGGGRYLPSGTYLYRFTAREVNGDRTFVRVKKMLLLK